MEKLPKGPIAIKEKGEIPKLPEIQKEDLFEKTMSSKKDEGKMFQELKRGVVSCIGWHAGAVAFALKMCEDPSFYRLIEDACLEREKKGYKELFKYTDLDPLRLLDEIYTNKKKPKNIYYYPPDMMNMLRSFPILDDIGEIKYNDLKKFAELSPDVKRETLALDYMLKNHREELKTRLTLTTPCADLHYEEAAVFIKGFLKVAAAKKLYDKVFGFADFGTASGAFSSEAVSIVKENFEKYKIVRTNVLEHPVSHHRDLKVRIHDMTEGPIGEKFDLIIIKDVMKFFNGNGRGRIWNNVTQDAKEGGVVMAGSFYTLGRSEFKPHVKHNGVLIRVNPWDFLGELTKVKDYQDYLKNLDGIVARSAYKEK